MRITAKVIEDSITHAGERITTLVLEYPRYLHGEVMTHRVFSRNAGSSRATPVEAMVNAVLEDPAFFLHIGQNKPGMQAEEEVSQEIQVRFATEWAALGRVVTEHVLRWAKQYKIHKQVANRALEPWTHIKVLVTATEWDNFFTLRDHPDAMPEIQALAKAMRAAMDESTPATLDMGKDWHLPFVQQEERQQHSMKVLLAMSVARCARVSYMNHDGSKPNVEKDIALHDQLLVAVPRHSSPSEHQATPEFYIPHVPRNFRGWTSYRQVLEDFPGVTI